MTTSTQGFKTTWAKKGKREKGKGKREKNECRHGSLRWSTSGAYLDRGQELQ
jgi:hypothetical protein